MRDFISFREGFEPQNHPPPPWLRHCSVKKKNFIQNFVPIFLGFVVQVATFQSLAATLNADCVELRQRPSDKGMTGQFLIRRRVDLDDFMEIR